MRSHGVVAVKLRYMSHIVYQCIGTMTTLLMVILTVLVIICFAYFWNRYQNFNTRGRGNNEAGTQNHEATAKAPDSQEILSNYVNMNTKHEVEQNVEGEKEESGKESTEDASVVRKRRMKETLKKDNEQPIVYSKQSLNTTAIDFETTPTFFKTIRTKAAKTDGKAIFGLSSLNQELFIISEHSSEVEVYDSESLTFKHQFRLDDLYDPIDIKSCSRNNCLYIIDWIEEESSEIFRVGSNGKLIANFNPGVGGGYISVTLEANVILSVWDKSLLKEFTADGLLIREIQLSASINELRIAIKLRNGRFIISQGETAESEHRVCLVDDKGSMLKSIGGEQGSSNGEFHSPNYLVVDESGFILVADQNNRRVVLLSPDFEFKKEVIRERDDLRYPVRMDLDRASGRLFVADNDYLEDQTGWRDGRVKAFDFKISQTS